LTNFPISASLTSNAAFLNILISAVTYCAYNSFSFKVLEKLDPVAHAVLNVLKRAFNIVTSMMFFGESITLQFCLSLSVAVAGLGLYVIGEKNLSIATILLNKTQLVFAAFFVCLLSKYS
jgi:hypothetical protein